MFSNIKTAPFYSQKMACSKKIDSVPLKVLLFIRSYWDFEQKKEMAKALSSQWKFLDCSHSMIHWNYDTLVSYYKKQWKLDILEILDKRAASGKRKGWNEERILVKKKKFSGMGGT